MLILHTLTRFARPPTLTLPLVGYWIHTRDARWNEWVPRLPLPPGEGWGEGKKFTESGARSDETVKIGWALFVPSPAR